MSVCNNAAPFLWGNNAAVSFAGGNTSAIPFAGGNTAAALSVSKVAVALSVAMVRAISFAMIGGIS